jgi:hypothetical protein
MTEAPLAGRGTFCTIVTEIVLLHPGAAELWLMSFLVKTELGWAHESAGTGVVVLVTTPVVVGAGVVLEELVVGTAVVEELDDGVGVVVISAVVDVVGATVVVLGLCVVVVGAGVVELELLLGVGVLDVVIVGVVELDEGMGVVAIGVVDDVVANAVVVATAVVVDDVVASHTGPITWPGSVFTDPPQDEHQLRFITTRIKHRWSIVMMAFGDDCWHSRFMMVKLNWHQALAPLCAGIAKESWPDVWFQSPAVCDSMLQSSQCITTPNVFASVGVSVPVTPEIVTREAFPMGTFVEKFTET